MNCYTILYKTGQISRFFKVLNKFNNPYAQGSKMKGKNCNRGFKGQTFNKVLGITVLAFLMLVSIAGASPFAYITNADSNSISVIDTTTNKVTATISVGSNPMGVVINPNGTKVYVGNAHSNDVSIIDTA
ncbi:MAG: hypothetical protein ABFC34_01900, partial [Methanobacterium sp.]